MIPVCPPNQYTRSCSALQPACSNAVSASAGELLKRLDENRRHLMESISLNGARSSALDELESAKEEANRTGWDGNSATPMHQDAYFRTKELLYSFPWDSPMPEIAPVKDGEIELDWSFGDRNALSLRIGRSGRLTYAWLQGPDSGHGTLWSHYGVPTPIANLLATLA